MRNLESRLRALEKAQKQRADSLKAHRDIDITAHIADIYKPLHEDIAAAAHQSYNLPGGRGSCKSSFVSLEIVGGIMEDLTGLSNAIIFRKWANTLRDSVFAQISWAIDELEV